MDPFGGIGMLTRAMHMQLASVCCFNVQLCKPCYLSTLSPVNRGRIAIGGILPRPCDRLLPTKLKAREETNTLLAALSKKINVHYIKTEIAIKGKGETSELYESDRLHLSPVGASHLHSYLGGRISSVLGIPRQWDPATKSILPR